MLQARLAGDQLVARDGQQKGENCMRNTQFPSAFPDISSRRSSNIILHTILEKYVRAFRAREILRVSNVTHFV